eukprot:gene27831-7201_t
MFNAGPYDIVQSTPSMLQGDQPACIKHINLHEEASGLLDVAYLSTAVPVELRKNSPCVNVFYLLDTGAHVCELGPTAFSALGAGAVPPRATLATINGVHCHVNLCAHDGNHPDIPVLGADFLTMMSAVLTVDYKLSTVSLAHS